MHKNITVNNDTPKVANLYFQGSRKAEVEKKSNFSHTISLRLDGKTLEEKYHLLLGRQDK